MAANETKRYVVTDVGGPRPDVGGRPRNVGEELLLTDKQARWEVNRGIVITLEESERRKLAAAAEAKAAEEKANPAHIDNPAPAEA